MEKKFKLGDIVATPGAIEAFSKVGTGLWQLEMLPYLARHQSGDWGNVPPEDARENELSVREGYRIMSSYEVDDQRVWVITEADRSVTTFLLPEEY